LGRRFRRDLCCGNAVVRFNAAQTFILTKRVTKKTRARSRTNARPALSHRSLRLLKRGGTLIVAAGYLFAVLVLFQFVFVRIALGFGEAPVVPSPVLLAAAVAPQPKQLPTTTRTTTTVATGVPVRLKIPGIRVDASIRPVGLTANGAMGVPKLPRDAAWYMYGPKPGQIGSAVISGHVNWWNGATSVFARLNTMKIGDKITVQDDKGTVTTFVVRKIASYGLNDDASNVFRSYDGQAHLNLVTCSGVWDRVAKVYSKRLVVFADKVAK